MNSNNAIVSFRPLEETDLREKIAWYNDQDINKYLHYLDDFNYVNTLKWFKNIQLDSTRFENVIEIESNGLINKIGIIGLFDIDFVNQKAGFYITIGNKEYQGKGIASKATRQFLKYCFENYELNKIFLYVDVDNVRARKLYESVGFSLEGILKQELFYKDRYIDRAYYGIFRNKFLERK